MSPEAVFIVSLMALAVAVVLTAATTVRAVSAAPDAPTRARHGEALPMASAIPVQVICPRTTLPTRVELARRAGPGAGLEVLSCAEFDGAPSCTQACVSMPEPLVRA